MASKLYSELSKVCHSFYGMYFPNDKIALIIDNYLKHYGCKKIVFFGGLTHVARILQDKGYEITFVDYTQEMIDEARAVLNPTTFIMSDMRELYLTEKQDAIVLMGRILTYLYTDNDVVKTLQAFKDSLKPGGIVILDNYETGKIDVGEYFSGSVKVRSKGLSITRTSKIARTRKSPALFKWDCIYEESKDGKKQIYEDKEHILRAFTRKEMKDLVSLSGLKFVENRENFEKRSFITVAVKK